VKCDQSLDQEGDACSVKDEQTGAGICAPGGNAVLVCRQGKFEKNQDCTSCTSDGTTVHCM
jgi:hypothetical protein